VNVRFAGKVETPAGEYQEITPQPRSIAAGSPGKEVAERDAALPSVVLPPWEFRVFTRRTP
jgi:hypothetical protein